MKLPKKVFEVFYKHIEVMDILNIHKMPLLEFALNSRDWVIHLNKNVIYTNSPTSEYIYRLNNQEVFLLKDWSDAFIKVISLAQKNEYEWILLTPKATPLAELTIYTF